MEKINKSAISLRHGELLMNGIVLLDSISAEFIATMESTEIRTLGDISPSTKYLGLKYHGTINRYRSTEFIYDVIDAFKKDLVTLEFKLTGRQADSGSDYYNEFGAKTITLSGCVFTGDMSLIKLDTKGDVYEDNLAFNAKDMKW